MTVLGVGLMHNRVVEKAAGVSKDVLLSSLDLHTRERRHSLSF
jgi:hypothetical protein